MKKMIVIVLTVFAIQACNDDSTPSAPRPFCGSSTFTDASGNVYSTVTIGTSCWLSTNLKTTLFNNGDTIPGIQDSILWSTTSGAAYCSYQNSSSIDPAYGKLYNFYAVSDNRGVCPVGTHVATDEEWAILTTDGGGMHAAGGVLKDTLPMHWAAPNTAANDTYGFSALPGGVRLYSGVFVGLSTQGRWWTSTDSTNQLAFDYYINFDSAGLYRDFDVKTSGFSVRCVVD